MRLNPGSSVTNTSAAADINRTKPVAVNADTTAPADGIRISNAFETLSVLNANHAVKVARIAAAVRGETYTVDSAGVGKAIVADAVGKKEGTG